MDQSNIWTSLKQKCIKQNIELEYKERSLQDKLKGTESLCDCDTSKNVIGNNKCDSTVSLKSEEIDYMKKITELCSREKEMQKDINQLEQREKTYRQILQEFEQTATQKNRFSSDVENELKKELEQINKYLKQENCQLRYDLDDLKLEFKQTLEKLEGPMHHQLQREKIKCDKLEEQLRLAYLSMKNSQECFLREMNSMKTQLESACTEMLDLSSTNQKLKRQLCELDCKYSNMEDELVQQKVQEAETINRIKSSLERKQANLPQTGAGEGEKNEEDLHMIARKLSQALKNVVPCKKCAKVQPDLVDTAQGLKGIVDMVHGKVGMKPGKKDCLCQSSVPDDSACQCDIPVKVNCDVNTAAAVEQRGITAESVRQCGCQTDSNVPKQIGTVIKVDSKLSVTFSGENIDSGTITAKSSGEVSSKSDRASSKTASKVSSRDSDKVSSKVSSKSSIKGSGTIITAKSSSKSRISEESGPAASSKASSKSGKSSKSESKGSVTQSDTSQQISAVAKSSSKSSRRTKSSKESSKTSVDFPKGYAISHEIIAEDVKKIKSSTSIKHLAKDVPLTSELPFDVETKVDIIDKPPEGVHVITTITGSGTLEVVTEGPNGVIETTLTYTESGKIEVVTELVNYEDHTRKSQGSPSPELPSNLPGDSSYPGISEVTVKTSSMTSSAKPSEAISLKSENKSKSETRTVNMNESVSVYTEGGRGEESLKVTGIIEYGEPDLNEDVSASLPVSSQEELTSDLLVTAQTSLDEVTFDDAFKTEDGLTTDEDELRTDKDLEHHLADKDRVAQLDEPFNAEKLTEVEGAIESPEHIVTAVPLESTEALEELPDTEYESLKILAGDEKAFDEPPTLSSELLEESPQVTDEISEGGEPYTKSPGEETAESLKVKSVDIIPVLPDLLQGDVAEPIIEEAAPKVSEELDIERETGESVGDISPQVEPEPAIQPLETLQSPEQTIDQVKDEVTDLLREDVAESITEEAAPKVSEELDIERETGESVGDISPQVESEPAIQPPETLQSPEQTIDQVKDEVTDLLQEDVAESITEEAAPKVSEELDIEKETGESVGDISPQVESEPAIQPPEILQSPEQTISQVEVEPEAEEAKETSSAGEFAIQPEDVAQPAVVLVSEYEVGPTDEETIDEFFAEPVEVMLSAPEEVEIREDIPPPEAVEEPVAIFEDIPPPPVTLIEYEIQLEQIEIQEDIPPPTREAFEILDDIPLPSLLSEITSNEIRQEFTVTTASSVSISKKPPSKESKLKSVSELKEYVSDVMEKTNKEVMQALEDVISVDLISIENKDAEETLATVKAPSLHKISEEKISTVESGENDLPEIAFVAEAVAEVTVVKELSISSKPATTAESDAVSPQSEIEEQSTRKPEELTITVEIEEQFITEPETLTEQQDISRQEVQEQIQEEPTEDSGSAKKAQIVEDSFERDKITIQEVQEHMQEEPTEDSGSAKQAQMVEDLVERDKITMQEVQKQIQEEPTEDSGSAKQAQMVEDLVERDKITTQEVQKQIQEEPTEDSGSTKQAQMVEDLVERDKITTQEVQKQIQEESTEDSGSAKQAQIVEDSFERDKITMQEVQKQIQKEPTEDSGSAKQAQIVKDSFERDKISMQEVQKQIQEEPTEDSGSAKQAQIVEDLFERDKITMQEVQKQIQEEPTEDSGSAKQAQIVEDVFERDKITTQEVQKQIQEESTEDSGSAKQAQIVKDSFERDKISMQEVQEHMQEEPKEDSGPTIIEAQIVEDLFERDVSKEKLDSKKIEMSSESDFSKQSPVEVEDVKDEILSDTDNKKEEHETVEILSDTDSKEPKTSRRESTEVAKVGIEKGDKDSVGSKSSKRSRSIRSSRSSKGSDRGDQSSKGTKGSRSQVEQQSKEAPTPTGKRPSSEPQEGRPYQLPKCDCVGVCKCLICAPEIMHARGKLGVDGAQDSTFQATCDCSKLKLNLAAVPEKKADQFIECVCFECISHGQVEAPHQADCTCLDCLCGPKNTEKKRPKSNDHPPGCSCLKCICKPCRKTPKNGPVKEPKTHGSGCSCPSCLCKPICKHKSKHSSKPALDNQGTTIIEQAPKATKEKLIHGSDCECIDCLFKTCANVECANVLDQTCNAFELQNIIPKSFQNILDRFVSCKCEDTKTTAAVTKSDDMKENEDGQYGPFEHPRGCTCTVCRCAECPEQALNMRDENFDENNASKEYKENEDGQYGPFEHPRGCTCTVCRCDKCPEQALNMRDENNASKEYKGNEEYRAPDVILDNTEMPDYSVDLSSKGGSNNVHSVYKKAGAPSAETKNKIRSIKPTDHAEECDCPVCICQECDLSLIGACEASPASDDFLTSVFYQSEQTEQVNYYQSGNANDDEDIGEITAERDNRNQDVIEINEIIVLDSKTDQNGPVAKSLDETRLENVIEYVENEKTRSEEIPAGDVKEEMSAPVSIQPDGQEKINSRESIGDRTEIGAKHADSDTAKEIIVTSIDKPKNVDKISGQSKSPTEQRTVTNHSPLCDCEQCKCQQCMQETHKATNIPVGDHLSDGKCSPCDCLKCSCEKCKILRSSAIVVEQKLKENVHPKISKEDLSKTQKSLREDENQILHSTSCDCIACICDDCKRNSVKDKKTSKVACACDKCEQSMSKCKCLKDVTGRNEFGSADIDGSKQRQADLTEIMATLNQIRCACTEAEIQAVKTSNYENTLSGLQAALIQAKEKLTTQNQTLGLFNPEEPQFKSERHSEDLLLRPQMSAKCFIDVTAMEITDIRRISSDALLIKWSSAKNSLVSGYHIVINGECVSKVLSAKRTNALLSSLSFKENLNIEVYAVTKFGRCQPPALACFKKKK